MSSSFTRGTNLGSKFDKPARVHIAILAGTHSNNNKTESVITSSTNKVPAVMCTGRRRPARQNTPSCLGTAEKRRGLRVRDTTRLSYSYTPVEKEKESFRALTSIKLQLQTC